MIPPSGRRCPEGADEGDADDYRDKCRLSASDALPVLPVQRYCLVSNKLLKRGVVPRHKIPAEHEASLRVAFDPSGSLRVIAGQRKND